MSTFQEFPTGMPHDTQSFTPHDRAVLTETARLLMMFAASQKSTNELLLLRAAVGADVPLKPREIGLFEPTRMPDSLAAIHFIDDFTTAAIYYGEEATRKVLRRCCANTVARSWIAGLDDGDRLALQVSTHAWERLIRRDFFPSRGIREDQARAEKFKWTQNRTPAEYVTSKLTLLRIAGITDHDRVIWEIHDGFKSCPEIQIPLEHFIKDCGNRISEYRRQVQKYQDSARLLYEQSVRSKLYQHEHADVFFGTGRKNDHSKHSRPPTPKPSECRHCCEAFPSRSRLHAHLWTAGHHQRKNNRRQPGQHQRAFMGITVPSMARRPAATPLEPEETTSSHSNRHQPEQYQRAFMGITLPSMATGTPTTTPLGPDETYIPTPPSLDRFNNNTGYEGVTFKERRCQRTPVSDRRGASLSFSFKLTAEPPSPHCSSVTLAETETSTTVPSPQCSSVTLAETKTSTTRTSVPLPSQLPVRCSAILPATPAAPRLPAPPPATPRLAALELRFASMLMGRAMICRRITRQLIRWQVRPGRLKRQAK
jgi:hypothetical protein